MRGILAIVTGGALLALALGLFSLDGEGMPNAMRWLVGIFGAIITLAGYAHLKLRYRRHQAYSNGRDKRGTARLFRPVNPESDSATATVIFATSHAEWLMSVDLASIKGLETDLEEGLAARAWLGDDDNVYALDIGERRALPLSAGIPIDKTLKEKMTRTEERLARWDARHQKV